MILTAMKCEAEGDAIFQDGSLALIERYADLSHKTIFSGAIGFGEDVWLLPPSPTHEKLFLTPQVQR